MHTIENLNQRELVSNVFVEVNDYLCSKAKAFTEEVKATDVANGDRETFDNLVNNGELAMALMRLANFAKDEHIKYIKETIRLTNKLIHQSR